jgi:hypothetical protein
LSIVLRDISKDYTLNITHTLKVYLDEIPAKDSTTFGEPGRGKRLIPKTYCFTAFAYFGQAYAEQ